MIAAICPWCSAVLTEGATECPSCGANLVPDGDPNVPGVTAVDAASIIRSKAIPQSRNRLLSWISGEYPNDIPSKAEAQAIAPPDADVRLEILRLELEAEVANLQAETDALMAEAAAEGRTIELPEAEESAEGEEQPQAEAGAVDTAAAEAQPESAAAAEAKPESDASAVVATSEGDSDSVDASAEDRPPG